MMKPERRIRLPLGRGGALVEGVFLDRPNTFLVRTRLESGAVVEAHLADRGRLAETLMPGARMILAHADGSNRKTAFQAVAAWRGKILVSVDTHLPNRLIESALSERALAPFASLPIVRREVKRGSSRFDFVVSDDRGGSCIIEVKSAGLVLDGIGLFPDAPTTRGLRHLDELAALAGSGERTALIFVVQGGRARALRAHVAIDPDFATGLRRAARAGVEVLAYACPLTLRGITLGARVPVLDLS